MFIFDKVKPYQIFIMQIPLFYKREDKATVKIKCNI